MASIIFNLALFAAAILLYLKDSIFWAVIAAGWGLFRVLQGRISGLVRVLTRMGLDVPSEQNCNTAIEARIIIPEVLSHPAVKTAFVKLKGNGIVQPSRGSVGRVPSYRDPPLFRLVNVFITED
jgi:hypothetical protein